MVENKKQKIAFVVQRYGLEVNGGAELECRQYAERLVNDYDVDVLTSKAVDYMTWEDFYNNDEESINGVTIKRFSVFHPRNIVEFNKVNAKLLSGQQLTNDEEQEWLIKQGPYVPELIEYIRANEKHYKAFIFCTYLYYPTVEGLKYVREKAIIVPTAHDEIYLKMRMYNSVFTKPRAIFYNTTQELEFIEKKYGNSSIPHEVGGVGIEVPENIDTVGFREKYNINGDYVIYVGRIDEGKGCKQLFQYFLEFKTRNNYNLKLLLLGKPVIPVPEHEDIISLGFVSDVDKFDAIAGAKCLIMPSAFESLSMVVLESLALGNPVIVNGNCDVLKGHCRKSNAGLYYMNYFEFEGTLNYMLKHSEQQKLMGDNGLAYVKEYYQWDLIVAKLKVLIEGI